MGARPPVYAGGWLDRAAWLARRQYGPTARVRVRRVWYPRELVAVSVRADGAPEVTARGYSVSEAARWLCRELAPGECVAERVGVQHKRDQHPLCETSE